MLDYGLEGYGLYWYCIELIAGKVDKDNITFELEHDARIIARNVGSTAQKVEEIMRYFVKTGLFEDANGVITCLKIARRLDQSMTSNKQMREIIDNLKSHDSVMIESAKPMQDKIRLEEIRSEDIKKVQRFTPPTHQDALQYFQEKGFNNPVEASKFVDFYEMKGWMVGKNKMKDWKAAIRNWTKNMTPVAAQQQPKRPRAFGS